MAANTDVLVVGAGPVGVFMAAELCRHGVSCRIIDKNDGPAIDARASNIQTRTIEIFDAIDIADQFIDAGVRCRTVAFYTPEMECLNHIGFDELDSPFRFNLSLQQSKTEQYLTRHLATFGKHVERGVLLRSFSQDEHGVTAVLEHAQGGQESLRVSYLVGCDGAHSTVRHALGVAFAGEDYPKDFFVAEVTMDWHVPIPGRQTCFFVAPEGMVFYTPFREGRCLILADVGEGHGELTPFGEPSLEQLQSVVDKRTCGGTLRDLEWSAFFRVHGRQADPYRVGRIFLAGDAAHVQTPAGGQGLNTGVQDAHNLGWKLALVLNGGAPATILESYHAERHRAGKNMLVLNDYLYHVEMNSEVDLPLPEALRRQLALHLAGQEVIQRRMIRAVAELNINYRHSPIAAQHRGMLRSHEEDHPGFHGWHDFGAAPHAGDRAADARLTCYPLGDSRRFFQVLKGTKHHLVLFAGPLATETTYQHLQTIADTTTRTHGQTVAAHLVVPHEVPPQMQTSRDLLVDPRGELHHRYGASIECLYLIRPDGYVGFRSQPADAQALQSYLERIFG